MKREKKKVCLGGAGAALQLPGPPRSPPGPPKKPNPPRAARAADVHSIRCSLVPCENEEASLSTFRCGLIGRGKEGGVSESEREGGPTTAGRGAGEKRRARPTRSPPSACRLAAPSSHGLNRKKSKKNSRDGVDVLERGRGLGAAGAARGRRAHELRQEGPGKDALADGGRGGLGGAGGAVERRLLVVAIIVFHLHSST